MITDPDAPLNLDDVRAAIAGGAARTGWALSALLAEVERLRALPAVVEHAQLMSGGGFHVRNDAPEIKRIYPLAEWIVGSSRFGGKVFRRAVVVVEDWTEVTAAEGCPGYPHPRVATDQPSPVKTLRKKPIAVDTVLWDGTPERAAFLREWTARANLSMHLGSDFVTADQAFAGDEDRLWVEHQHVWSLLPVGHRVAREADGRGFYPLSPETVAQTYQDATGESP